MSLSSQYLEIKPTGLFPKKYTVHPNLIWLIEAVDLQKRVCVFVIVYDVSDFATMVMGNLLSELRNFFVITDRADRVLSFKLLIKHSLCRGSKQFVSCSVTLFPQSVQGVEKVALFISLPALGSILVLKTCILTGSMKEALVLLGILVIDRRLTRLNQRFHSVGWNR